MSKYNEAVVQALLRPFPPAAHEVLPGSGKRPALTYIGEAALIARLNEVAPGAWETELFDWHRTRQAVVRYEQPATDEEPAKLIEREHWTVGVSCRLTIFGVSRVRRGEASAETEPEKAADTDAQKRACRAHGIGAYLLELPPKDASRLTAEDYAAAARKVGWRGGVKSNGAPAPAPAPAPPSPKLESFGERVRESTSVTRCPECGGEGAHSAVCPRGSRPEPVCVGCGVTLRGARVTYCDTKLAGEMVCPTCEKTAAAHDEDGPADPFDVDEYGTQHGASYKSALLSGA